MHANENYGDDQGTHWSALIWHHAPASLEKLFFFRKYVFTPCNLSSCVTSLSFGLLWLHASQVVETLWLTSTIKTSNKVLACLKTKPLSGPAVKIRLEPVQAWRTRQRNQSFAGVAHRVFLDAAKNYPSSSTTTTTTKPDYFLPKRILHPITLTVFANCKGFPTHYRDAKHKL